MTLNAAHSPSSPQASPLDTPSEELSTRDRLLHVAAELFAERGYNGASLGEIASRLGIRKPSLYNHIASKDELFMELLERSLDAWQQASDSPMEGGGSHRQRLRRHLQTTVDFAVEHPHATALCRLAVSQVSGELEERASALLLRHRTEYQQQMEVFFDAAVEAGEVVGTSPEGGTSWQAPSTEGLAFSWLTFLDGILMHQIFSLGSRREAYLHRLDELWQLYWRGLATLEARDV